MNVTIKRILNKSISITVTVMMAVTCFAVINTEYSYAAKKEKVTNVTLTNVGDVYTIEKGKSMKLTYSIKASKKKYKKVKWKSSNKKVVKVTKKGKIKAKKKGVAYITVYSKTNKKKDSVKIVVGTPVTSVTISGSETYVEKGNQQKLLVTVNPSNASDKGLTWKSSNNDIATVSQSGVVTGKRRGTVMIKAFAKDGTGKYGWIAVKVVELKRSDAVFIAHRGYSSMAPENTLAAFALASQYNFHGAEMDVWESYSYKKEVPNPDYVPPEEDYEAQDGRKVEPKSSNESEIQGVLESEPQDANELEGLKVEGAETPDEDEAEPLVIDEDESLDVGELEPQKKDAVEQQDIDKFADETETRDQAVRAAGLRNTDSPTMTITTFDLNVMHNQMTEAMCGESKNVDIRTINDTNREQYPIKKGNRVSSYSTLYIPTLDQALEILYKENKKTGHNTLPVIELKQGSYSVAAIERVLDLIEQYGGKATIISFEESALSQAQAEIDKRVKAGTIVKGDVQTQYLVVRNTKSGVNTCVSKHFDGISIKYTEVTQSIVDYAHKRGLIVAAWTIPSTTEAARIIDLGVDRITSDYKLFED